MFLDDPVQKFFVAIIFLVAFAATLPIWIFFNDPRVPMMFLGLSIFMFAWFYVESKYSYYRTD